MEGSMREIDAVLVSRAAIGNKEAFVDIVERYRKAIIGTAYGYLNDPNDVEDAVQNTVINAYMHLAGLREPDKFGAWIVSITRRACLDIMRNKPVVIDREPVHCCQVSSDFEKRLQVREALARLGEDKRITVILAYVHGYSHAEISQLLDIPITTVRSRLRDAKSKLAGHLANIVDVTQQIKPEIVLERSRIMKLIDFGSEDVFWSETGETSYNGADANYLTLSGRTLVISSHIWSDLYTKAIGIDDPYTAGWTAASAALSKVAAAGGRPVSSYVNLGANPWYQKSDYITRLCDGIRDAAGQFQQEVPRFNLGYGSSREHIGIVVTQTGVSESPKPAGVQAGDAIIVTNTLGDSITAVEVIKHKLYHSEEEKLRLIKQHIEVKPRANEALAVWESGLATSVQLTYRGLTTDLRYFSRANGVGALINLDSLPVTDEVKKWAPQLNDLSNDHLFIAGSGNEDYELLITCRQKDANVLISSIESAGSKASVIGEVTGEPEVLLKYPDGTVAAEPNSWRHF